jgi:hypothetical protein
MTVQTYNDPEDNGATELPCADKLIFDTQRLASATANVAQYQHGTVLRPYRCRYCQLWHLTSV